MMIKMCVFVYTSMCHIKCGDQRTPFKSWFFPSTFTWLPGIELRLLGSQSTVMANLVVNLNRKQDNK